MRMMNRNVDWERETKRANLIFDSRNYEEAQLAYQNLPNDSWIRLRKIDINDFFEFVQALNQLLITVDNLCEVYKANNDQLSDIKMKVIAVDTILTHLKSCTHDHAKTNVLLKFYNRAFLNYCRSISGIHMEFVKRIVRSTLSEPEKFRAFFAHQNYL